jgi:hypothetical protein
MYLDAKAAIKNGVIHATAGDLQSAGVDTSKDFFLRYYNIRDFEGVDAHNFDLETKLKCERLGMGGRLSTVPCPLMEIMIITEQNVFFVPLTIKGCVSELEILVGEVYKGGKDNDLSLFGTDVYEWQTLHIKSENKNVSILLNSVVAHELSFKEDFGKIKGILYTFTGPGSVDFLRMKNTKGETVYEDDFEMKLPL